MQLTMWIILIREKQHQFILHFKKQSIVNIGKLRLDRKFSKPIIRTLRNPRNFVRFTSLEY